MLHNGKGIKERNYFCVYSKQFIELNLSIYINMLASRWHIPS